MLTRKCPECGSLIEYVTKGGYNTAIKNQSICRKCASIKSGFTERYATKGKNCGKDNAFYKKQHTNESKQKISESKTGRIMSDNEKENLRTKNIGKKNPMYGKTYYDIWVNKYGKEQADLLQAEKKKKHSKFSSGKNNPMYGKPSPTGSGNGWKGYFLSYYFRSLRELCYMIQLYESGQNWATGETLSIQYKFFDQERTYRPDFIVNEIYVVEIKPMRLFNSPNNTAKFQAAKDFCARNGFTFEVIDINIDPEQIKKHIAKITFDDRYTEKAKKWGLL